MKSKKDISLLLIFLCAIFPLLAFEAKIEKYDFSEAKATEAFKSDVNSSIAEAKDQQARIEREIKLVKEDKDRLVLKEKEKYFAGISSNLSAKLDTFNTNETKYKDAIDTGDVNAANKISKETGKIVSDAQTKIDELNFNIEKAEESLGSSEVSSDPAGQQEPIKQQKSEARDESVIDPTSEKESKGIDFTEAKEAEGEGEIVAALVDGFIEYVLGTIFVQWGANIYISLPEFGAALFKLLFDDIKLDWSPLEFNFTDIDLEISNAVQDVDNKVAVSDAFALLDKLQGYKGYFQQLVISYLRDSFLSSSEKKLMYREAGIVNVIEYRINKLDVSVLGDIDALFVKPKRISLIESVIQGLSETNQFSWLVLNTISPSSIQSNIKTISKLDLLKIMKTMQRLEGAFMAKLTSILDSGILPSEKEKNAIISLANLLNHFSVKIENQDPQVFLDLAAADAKIQEGIVGKDQTASDQIKAMESLILKYSQQP